MTKPRKSKPLAKAADVAAPAESQSQETTPRLIARVPLSIRWRDLDAFNHVNNASFLTYVEEARLDWLSGVEGPWFGESLMPIVAATHMNYRRQLAWPGSVAVELYCTRLGTTSVTLGHRIVAPGNAELVYADGDTVLVWIDPQSGRPVPLPDVIRHAVQPPESGAITSK